MAQINSVFNFLKEYNELSNPVVTEIDKQKWNLKLSGLPQIKELWSIYDVMDFDNEKILEVKRPNIRPCPVPENNIILWIDGDWKNINKENIKYKEKLIEEFLDDEGNISHIEILFNDEPMRIVDFDEWSIKRGNWRTVELPKKQGLDLYNNLFKLYSDIKKESESVELILGDGKIVWNTRERIINHPVFLQKVHLEFDSEKPSFIIKCDEIKTELYTPMLRIIKSINQSMLSETIQEVENSFYHIADKSNNIGLFERLINVVDTEGKYVEKYESGYSGPIILQEPVLFLRKRTLGYSTFLDKIIEDIDQNEDFTPPDFFGNMIGNHKENQTEKIIGDSWNQSGVDEDILLTLPANNEQLKIIKYLNSYGAVLVQGPPGTGKTHTIANLIGHLLSQGNSVLVTSHTEKALTVLKEKVYKKLQSLCISLLSTSSQKKEMDATLFEMAEKGTSIDLNESKKKIDKLTASRKSLIDKYKSRDAELIRIRSLEYKDLIFDNKTIKPIDAAKLINSGIGSIDYILGETRDDTIGLPLSEDDLKLLYKSNVLISLDEEGLLNRDIPKIENIWDAKIFAVKKNEYEELENSLFGWTPKLLLKDDLDNLKIVELLEKCHDVFDGFNALEDFQYEIINKTITDSVYSSFWEKIFIEFDELLLNYENWRKINFEDELVIPEDLKNAETISFLEEIINTNKEIPVSGLNALTKPKWKKIRDGIKIKNKTIEKRNEYEKAKTIISYELERNSLYIKLNKLLSELSGEAKLDIDDFEEKAKQNKQKIEIALNWYKNTWARLMENISACIDKSCVLDDLLAIDYSNVVQSFSDKLRNIIIFDLEKYAMNTKYTNLKLEWKEYSEFVVKYKHFGNPFNELINAMAEKEIALYNQSFELLVGIYNKKEVFDTRNELLKKIEIEAPKWADDISERRGIHGSGEVPVNIVSAWKWRQISNQINKLDVYDPNKIQREIDKINEALMMNAKNLAYEKAWFEKIKNKTSAQTQAIEGWRQTMKRVGKGTGKSAPRLLNKARELMPLCQTAIPVWIMPLSRVAESFDPQENKFDVVIIDEASQANILALSALYLGKKVIIVGDDEQVSPDSVGMKDEEVNALIEQHLRDIPNNHLFTGKTSVYDMAKASGFKTLMLTEHFRCLPEIIEFSNQLSYNGKIKPLRDASDVMTTPSMVEYRVPDGIKNDKKINENEAKHIASLVCACVENDNYKGKTIGVISLLGKEQAYEIDKLLQINMNSKEYEDRRIQCGTSPQFQGDERDIIFLSVVEGPKEKGGPVTLVSEDGRNDMYRKRYNVASSRAKDQMWVVHSLNPEIDLKPEDLRLKLIKHAMNPIINTFDSKLNLAESDFEEKVMTTLLNKGYKVIPQWRVGSYRIDMVIEDGKNKVALECDGEKWHSQDNLADDLKRQAILERLGWKFIRIRGSAYYRNPEKSMDVVYSELEDYKINPNYRDEKNDVSNIVVEENKIIDQIKRRANSIRLEWVGETEMFSESSSEVVGDDTKNVAVDTAGDLKSTTVIKSEGKGSIDGYDEIHRQETPVDNITDAMPKNINKKIDVIRTSETNDKKGKLEIERNINDKEGSENYKFDFLKKMKLLIKIKAIIIR